MADRFMRTTTPALGPLLPRATLDKIKKRLQVARHFVLDDPAAERLAEMVTSVPDLLLRQQAFARAPYDVTWIEFPFLPVHRAIYPNDPEEESDTAYGYLIDHNSVYTIGGGEPANPMASPMCLPWTYRLHTPWTDEGRSTFCGMTGIPDRELDDFLWGQGTTGLLRTAGDLAPRLHHSCDVAEFTVADDRPRLRNLLRELTVAGQGDLRNVVTLLLLLNRPRTTTFIRDVPARRGFHKGKMSSFFAHTRVTINLSRTDLAAGLEERGAGGPKRRHEVRGHWCHRWPEARKPGCIHVWQRHPEHEGEDPAEPGHWLCAECGLSRWWRASFLRGDASLGWVHKGYSVTA